MIQLGETLVIYFYSVDIQLYIYIYKGQSMNKRNLKLNE